MRTPIVLRVDQASLLSVLNEHSKRNRRLARMNDLLARACSYLVTGLAECSSRVAY